MLTKLKLLELLRRPGTHVHRDMQKWYLCVGHIEREIPNGIVHGLYIDGLVRIEVRGRRISVIPK